MYQFTSDLEAIEDRLQQPLTAMRLLVEGALDGVVEASPDTLGRVLICLAEMQEIIDDANSQSGDAVLSGRTG